MAFTPVPSESKSQINKAGRILASNAFISPDDLAFQINEIEAAQDLANRWRASHAYPINTFQATLRQKLRNIKGAPIVAQRLKRMPTLVDKLRRYKNMQLTTMQDIGGLRAIVEDVDDVY